eukprot:TRINITY_DN418_c0_g1_i1.p1 TRINITY_DN418_c0_g1~~TRINITY_DN418_c0_g1_i1.p1  ORF type:complete len:160 (+),score=24.22 TRINITY_DN418_c0_g1_i1:164-643(+)
MFTVMRSYHVIFLLVNFVENWNDDKSYIYQRVIQIVMEKTKPLFQENLGYGCDEVGKAKLCMAASCVTKKFDCVGTTLEMAYKNLKYPQERSWDHEECQTLGRQFVEAMLETCSILKEKKPNQFPPLSHGPHLATKSKVEEPSYKHSKQKKITEFFKQD